LSSNLKLAGSEEIIAKPILKEIIQRLKFLNDVGVGYLTLERSAGTLSGGEAQRIRLATQIGSRLMGVLYILDEPSIGLHQRDNTKLINTLKDLRNIGNTVLVIEHDEETMTEADYIIDMGPGAGVHGGNVIAEGTPSDIKKNKNSITGRYLSGKEKIQIPSSRRSGNGQKLKVIGATENNLKNIDIEFPLGCLSVVTGVSGSGKSTLINETLYPLLSKHCYDSKADPMPYKRIVGLEHVDKEQAKEDWMKFIQEDPAGLLRQKFRRDYQRAQEEGRV
jgi:excinuclease ABC subunit A